MILEIFTPTIGMVGFVGAILFGFGLVLFLEGSLLGYVVALIVIIAAFLFLLLSLALRARKKPIVSGYEEVMGSIGEVEAVEGKLARMRLRGEIWQVKSDEPLKKGDKVEVTGREGLILVVRRKL